MNQLYLAKLLMVVVRTLIKPHKENTVITLYVCITVHVYILHNVCLVYVHEYICYVFFYPYFLLTMTDNQQT